MNKNEPLAGALHSNDIALSEAQKIGDIPDCRANVKISDHVQRLLEALEQTRAEMLTASNLIAEQSAHIRELSVVAINSTVRGF